MLQFGHEHAPGFDARAWHDVRDGLDQAILILPTGHAAGLDSWMFEQQVFDLRRAHPDPTDLEHVVRAAREPEEAVLVLAVLVTGADPMSADRVLRLLVSIPVKGTGRVTADDEVAQVAGRDRLAMFVDEARLVSRHHEATGARRERDPVDWR